MDRARHARWPWLITVGTALACVVGFAFEIKALHTPLPPAWFGPRAYAIPLAMAFAITGPLIATREPRNRIGWIICVGAIMGAIQAMANPYVVWSVGAQHDRSLAVGIAANLIEWIWIPPVAILGVVFALFPNGHLLSRRWAIWMGVALAGTTIFLIGNILISPMTYYPDLANPIGVRGAVLVGNAFAPALLAVLLIGCASLVVRFRHAHGEEREQLKWVTLAAGWLVFIFAVYVVAFLTWWAFHPDQDVSRVDTTIGIRVLSWFMLVAILAIPVAIAVAILKYRLYDVDLVIRKSVVFGVLVLMMTAAFLITAVVLGAVVAGTATWVPVAIAFAVGALLGPFRRIAERVADRWVFGGRATPYEVLTEFSRRASDAYASDDVLPRMAAIAAAGVGADRARVWVRVGRDLAVGASTGEAAPAVPLEGEALPALPEDHAAPVFHRGELLGAIGVTMPLSDPLTPERTRLIGDLASQAGAVLANVGLIEELRASRQRLVSAQDETRRRLERNIHDGAQQQLVALAVKLRLLQQVAERDPAKIGSMAEQLQQDAGDALETLRDLARGIYPPLLADQGLATALEAQARKAAIPVEIESNGLGRYPPDVEATVYFCTLEALNNAAKYAEARRVVVRLARQEDSLTFVVEDDGRGFDAATAAMGTGLQGMTDRLDALGGDLRVASEPGHGTRVTGSIPVGTARLPEPDLSTNR